MNTFPMLEQYGPRCTWSVQNETKRYATERNTTQRSTAQVAKQSKVCLLDNNFLSKFIFITNHKIPVIRVHSNTNVTFVISR